MENEIIEFDGGKWVLAYMFHLSSKSLAIWTTLREITTDSLFALIAAMEKRKDVIYSVPKEQWAAMTDQEKMVALSIAGRIGIQVNPDTYVGEVFIYSDKEFKKHLAKWS